MYKRREESGYVQGNGYKINYTPTDVNYNTCSVKYTLNHDFSINPDVQYKGSTNTHSRRPHTDVDASTNRQRPSGVNCSRPINNQRPSGMGAQRTSGTARPAAKKASPLGLLIFPLIIAFIIFFSINGEGAASIIPFIVIVAAIFSSINNNKRRR